MKQKLLIALMMLASVLTVVNADAAKKKVHTIGDSTMADYATDGSTDKRGWAQMLQQFFNSDNVTVNNRGKSGASSKSFYKEAAYWPTLVKGGSDQMQAGDYLLIQFAHNDEKTSGTDGDELIAYYKAKGDAASAAAVDYRGTTAFGTFKTYIRNYINEAKAMGVTPIVVAPICRKYFSGNDIRRNGRHDLGDNFNVIKDGVLLTGQKVAATDDTYDYVESAKAVAAEYDDVPFIDLTTLTANLYIKYGEAYCTSNLFCNDDSTHPCALGATLIAREFAQQLKAQANSETDPKKKAVLEGLAKDVIVSNEITFNPISGDLGEAYVGMNVTKEYNVSAFGLAAETGKFTLSATDGFKVSTDKTNWSNSIDVAYDGFSLISTIYVRANINAAGEQTGTLTATDGTNTKTLDLKVNGISLTGGEETTCVWPLNSKSLAATSTLLTASDVTLSGMTAPGNIGTPTVPEGHGGMLLFNIDGGSWPAGEIDEVSTRYIQFQATVPSDKVFNMDKISLDLMGWGGNSVCYHAYYATKPDFSDQVLIGEGLKMTNKTAVSISSDVVRKLEEGESIYIRVYPWLSTNSAATGKYMCISDVTIHGMMSEAGGEAVTVDGNISYTLVDSEPALDPAQLAVGFAGLSVSYGNLLTVSQNGGISWSGSDGSMTQTKIYNGTGSSLPTSAVDGNTITFTLNPEEGMVFIPSKVSFNAARYGTDGGNITASIEANGSAKICENEGVNRSAKSLALKNISAEVSGVAADAEHPLKLKISVVGLGNTKTVGIDHIVIEGKLQGTISQTTKYTLNYSVSPEGAGVITVDPNMDSYKEGKTVTLTAAKNFGYKFVKWVEGEEELTTSTVNEIVMDKDRSVTAVFEPVPVYTVSAKCVNDLEMSLGSVTLSPDEHEGKYEEGTAITATAEESKILKFAGWGDDNMNSSTTTATRQITVDKDMELVANYQVQDFIAVFDASKTQTYAYNTTASYPFGADLTWDADRNAKASVVRVSDGSLAYTQSTGTPVVRNREGVVLAGINGLYQNGYRTSDIAWQYQFSTKGFTSATFTGDMAAKNMADKTWKAQYSLTGDNASFKDIEGATWDMTANVICPVSINLPADAIGQETVYLRILGTGGTLLSSAYNFDKTFDGLAYCDHSESGVGNVYIIGEAEAQDDGVAPSVTGTTPVNGATNISASGAVTISYSERIESGNLQGAALTIAGNGESKTVEPVWNSRSISFNYANLAYGQTYTVSVPAGYVIDKGGNAADAYEFSFTVMNRQKPAARTFDAIVDASLTQLAYRGSASGTINKIPATEDMPAQYRTIQDAIDDAPASPAAPYLIYIKEGYYRDPNFSFNDSYGTKYTDNRADATGSETERIAGGINEYDSCRIVCINKPNIHLIGQDLEKVTIATDRFDGSCSDHSRVWYHINAGATVEVQAKGTDFYMEGVTVDNENWTKKKMAGPQALCFNISGDRAVLNNVRARSYQDTYYNGGDFNRTFWNNSEIEGSVDFIYGSSDVWFEGCTLNINRDKGGFIVAPNHSDAVRWGYVFNNTRITTDDVSDPSKYSIWLGRPWHNNPKTVFLHTQMELTPMDSLWYETMGGLPSVWAVYDFHDKNGYALSEISREYYYSTSDGVKTWGRAKNSLTAEEVAQYTISNVFAGDGTTSANGYWNPQPMVEKTSKPVLVQNNGEVSWEADEYAICYVVTVNGKPVAFPTDTRYVAQDGDVVTVQSVNENGGLSEMSEPLTVDATATAITGPQTLNAIPADGKIYNLAGQRLSAPRKGIIIRGGKSVVEK